MIEENKAQHDVDVIVIGGSIAATSTALALSAQGIQVAIVDKGIHPRFALGESLLKPTVLWMRLIAERFNVPELNVLANVDKINRQVAPTSGIKKCFGFVKHEADKADVCDQWWSNLAVSYGEQVSEAHLFRQDVDSYLFHVATQKCALALSGTAIQEISFSDEQVDVKLEHINLSGRYVIDCTGPGSVLAKQFELRDSPAKFRSESRTVFTHMIDVKPFDDCEAAPTPAIDWHEGTLHHLLDDAWIWVIPFDNHAHSTNPLVSVGVTFYGKHLSANGESAESEWANLLNTYPALNRQFNAAKPVRPWIGTGTLQYSSSTSIGERYCLLGASYGGIDALFSRGLLNTMQSIFLVSDLLVDAVKHDTFDLERFLPINKLQSRQLELNDLLTYGFYNCTGSSVLTSWWLVIWIFVEQNSISHALSALSSFSADDEKCWDRARSEIQQGLSIANEDTLLAALRAAANTVESFRRKEISESEAQCRLEEDCGVLLPLGFNYPQYSNLLNKVVFHPQARALMQVEYALASILDDIDNGMKLGGRMRSVGLAMCIIKLIATDAAAQAKKLRDADEHVLTLDNSDNSLLSRLSATAHKWLPDVARRDAAIALSALLHSITYRESCDAPAMPHPGSGWTTLLASGDNGSQMTILFRSANGDFELQVSSSHYGKFRSFACTGQLRLFHGTDFENALARQSTESSGKIDSRKTAA